MRLFSAVGICLCVFQVATGAGPELPKPSVHAPRLAEPVMVAGQRLAVPTPQQAAWADLEVGMFIHIAPQTWQDSETDTMKTDLKEMVLEKLDTDQWVRVAEGMGAKYIVFVAKHEGGFCWWPTETTEHCVRNIPWRGGKGDVLGELAASCKKRGMKLGVYVSPQDKAFGALVGGKTKDVTKQAAYEEVFRKQLAEVLSLYKDVNGEMIEAWFDGSLVFDVGDILEKHAPNAMVFQGPQATIRWVGNEAGVVAGPAWNSVKGGVKKWGDYVGEDGVSDGDKWLPNEVDARIRATWFWRTDNAKTLKGLPALMEMYETSVGRGGVLLLNNTPDRSGLIPETDATRSLEFGAEVKRVFGVPVIDTAGTGNEFELTLSSPREVDRVVIAEEIEKGERVRAWVVEGMKDGKWELLCEGKEVGHKRIAKFAACTPEKVRLRITESVGEPLIRSFGLYRAGR